MTGWIGSLREPHRLFTFLSLLFGLLYVFLTPPFRAPDEVGHYMRVLAYSHGALWENYERRSAYHDLALTYRDLLPQSGSRGSTQSAEDMKALWEAGTQEPKATEQVRANGPTVDLYSPVAYLPAIGVTALLEFADPRPIITFYAMRLSLLVSSTLLIGWAIKHLRVIAWPLTFAMLWPMMIWLRGVITADSLTTAYVFALFALTFGSARLSSLRLTVVALAVSLSKIVFVSNMVLLALPEHLRKWQSKWRYVLSALLGVLCIVTAIGWNLMAKETLEEAIERGKLKSNPKAQIELILNSPDVLITALSDTLDRQTFWGDWAAAGAVGYFAEHDITLSVDLCLYIMLFTLLLLFIRPAEDAPPPRTITRLMMLLLFSGTFLLMLIALYIQWNPLGADQIGGFQGRYLAPLLPAVLLALVPPAKCRFVSHHNVPVVLGTTVILLQLVTTHTLMHGFYG